MLSDVVAESKRNPITAYVARGISDYLTRETGVTVVFETAVVPKWKDSRISFKNVYVSRRPRLAPGATEFKHEDLSMAMFDLDIDSIDVTLSLWRWLDGKGIVTDAVVKGVRGVVGEHVLCIHVSRGLITSAYRPNWRVLRSRKPTETGRLPTFTTARRF